MEQHDRKKDTTRDDAETTILLFPLVVVVIMVGEGDFDDDDDDMVMKTHKPRDTSNQRADQSKIIVAKRNLLCGGLA